MGDTVRNESPPAITGSAERVVQIRMQGKDAGFTGCGDSWIQPVDNRGSRGMGNSRHGSAIISMGYGSLFELFPVAVTKIPGDNTSGIWIGANGILDTTHPKQRTIIFTEETTRSTRGL